MSKRDVVGKLAQSSRAKLRHHVERRGLQAIAVHDAALEHLRHRIVELGGDPRSFDVLVGVVICLEELPPIFNRAHSFLGIRFWTMLGLVAELVEAAEEETCARELLAQLGEGASPPKADG